MNRRLATLFLFAFLIAALASYLVFRMVTGMAGAPRPQTATIIMAAHDLDIGSVIKDVDLKAGNWVGELPKGAVTSKETLVGRGVISTVYQGEPVLDSRLAAPGSGGGLAATIRPGMRACAVRVNEVVGVAGFVLPGMRVDVLVSGSNPGSPSEGPKVKTLLQNIEVLSAGTNIQKDAEGKPVQVQVVNLLVKPEEAELLSLAGNETKIQLVLRNPLDTEVAKTSGAAMSGLFSDGAPKKVVPVVHRPAPKPEVAPPPRIYLVEVLNGGKKSEEKFGDRTDTQK